VAVLGSGTVATLQESQFRSTVGSSDVAEGPGANELRKVTFVELRERANQFQDTDTSPFTAPEYTSVKARVSARSQVLVPNTSCGSCHALQQDNALKLGAHRADSSNLHNLSYFQAGAVDRGISPSPRVVQDVRFDLQWIASQLNLLQ
jgi:hypothetical protein